MTNISKDALVVKELGPAIGRSASFVYKMRMAGFRMVMGRATRAEAIAWIDQKCFRVVNGRPTVKAK